ncbi:colicin V family bacteriocin [Escherichia coli]|nr:colicin V family bacteriocin [Escherichia coli]
MNNVSGAGDVNWVDVGKNCSNKRCRGGLAAFGAGLCGPVCAGAFAVDLQPLLLLCMMQQEIPTQRNKNQEGLTSRSMNYAEGRMLIGVQIILVMFVYK